MPETLRNDLKIARAALAALICSALSLGFSNLARSNPGAALSPRRRPCVFPTHREPGRLTNGNSPGFSKLAEPVWTGARQELWLRIEQHDFEPDTPLNFTRRLARDHGWSLEEARAAVEAYRRFCFLAIVSPTPVTPSEVVDEVWHQHLTYSRDYWMIWCGERLKAQLHHDPTPGGSEAQAIYRRQYAETLALHERMFGPPTEELWPATHLRFGRRRYHVTDRSRWHIVPKPLAWIRHQFRR